MGLKAQGHRVIESSSFSKGTGGTVADGSNQRSEMEGIFSDVK